MVTVKPAFICSFMLKLLLVHCLKIEMQTPVSAGEQKAWANERIKAVNVLNTSPQLGTISSKLYFHFQIVWISDGSFVRKFILRFYLLCLLIRFLELSFKSLYFSLG